MSKPELVPFPDITPEEHNITFDGLALPQGFKDEQLLVDVDRLNLLRRISGLGQISVVGTAGESQAYNAQISGVNDNGEATLGLGIFRKKNPLVNGVSLSDGGVNSIRLLFEPDATIAVDLTERDARLDDIDSPRRHFDPKNHAGLLNSALKKGIKEAATQRYKTSTGGFLIGWTAGGLTYGISNDIMNIVSHNPEPAISTGIMVGMCSAIDLVSAKIIRNIAKDEDIPAIKVSALFGLDRLAGTIALANFSKLVVAAK